MTPTLTINPDGTIAIAIAGRVVLSGALALYPAAPIQQVGLSYGAVVTSYPGYRTTVTYRLVVNDLEVQAFVEADPGFAIPRVIFHGLAAKLSNPVGGTLRSHNGNELKPGGGLFPGTWHAAGCYSAYDRTAAICCYSRGCIERDEEYAFNVTGSNSAVGETQTPLMLANETQNVELYTSGPVPPGGRYDVAFTIRVTDELSMDGLYAGWRSILADVAPMAYTADRRPALQSADVTQQHITPESPQGFAAPSRQLGTADGVAGFVDMVSAAAGKVSAVLMLAPGGFETGNNWYPITYDTNAQRNIATLPALVAGLKAAGIRPGIYMRPTNKLVNGEPVKVDPTTADLAESMARVRWVVLAGFEAAYLDSSGNCGMADVVTLREARKVTGPSFQGWTEYFNVLTLASFGGYCELTSFDAPTKTPGLGCTDGAQLPVIRYLRPDAPLLCISRVAGAGSTEIAAAGMSPLYQDYEAAKVA